MPEGQILYKLRWDHATIWSLVPPEFGYDLPISNPEPNNYLQDIRTYIVFNTWDA